MSFTRVCSVADVPAGEGLAVDVETPTGAALGLVRDGDDWYAFDDECSHATIPLTEGDVEGCELECWLHGSRFDLRTGKPTGPPASEPVAIYPIRVEGDDVLVDVTTTINDK